MAPPHRGPHVAWNLRCCCHRCNSAKGARPRGQVGLALA
jgi:5-methylcytosine-specific restriction endonuclease McrA